MFTNHFQLKEQGAEKKLRAALKGGGEVVVLGLQFRYSGDDLLVVRVPSHLPSRQLSTGSAFEDMTRAETLLTVMGDEPWMATLLGERRVELELTDEMDKVWWSVEPGKVAWPEEIAFPITTSTRWTR